MKNNICSWLVIITLAFTMNNAFAGLIHSTTGKFSYIGINELADLEASGDLVGSGTSYLSIGIGICDPAFPNPFRPEDQDPDLFTLDCPANNIAFHGVTDNGDIPPGLFNMGRVTFFNGDVGAYIELVQYLELEISAQSCDTDAACETLSSRAGATTLSFAWTGNTASDLNASADGFCLTTLLGTGPELCAWVREFETQSFDIIAEFGSLNLIDIIPASRGGFVTQGRNPIANIVHQTQINEPGVFSIFFLSILGLIIKASMNIRTSKPDAPLI